MMTIKPWFVLLVALALVPAASIAGEISQVTISVKGLGCPFCVYGLEKKLRKVHGVKRVKVDLKSGAAVLTLNKEQSPDIAQFRKAVRKAGFTAGKITITAVGKVVFAKNQAHLKLGDQKGYILFEKDGAGATGLTNQTRKRLMGYAENGTLVAITGTVHPHADRSPGLSLDKVEPSPSR